MIDSLVYDRDGRGGRVAVVTRIEGYASGGGWVAPTAWVFLVVVDGKFEEWRASDCTTVRPVAKPAPCGRWSHACPVGGCKAAGCPA